MTQPHPRLVALSLSVVPLLFISAIASAQIGNAPYSFKGGSVGMSQAGRQAIINEKILGTQPDNLVRAPGGELLEVQKGPGGSALVSYPGTGQYIPQYHGISFREYHPEMSAGVFNSFFLPAVSTSSYSYSPITHSGATVSTWTSRITSGGMPMSYLDGNVVDSWTGQVLVMDGQH